MKIRSKARQKHEKHRPHVGEGNYWHNLKQLRSWDDMPAPEAQLGIGYLGPVHLFSHLCSAAAVVHAAPDICTNFSYVDVYQVIPWNHGLILLVI